MSARPNSAAAKSNSAGGIIVFCCEKGAAVIRQCSRQFIGAPHPVASPQADDFIAIAICELCKAKIKLKPLKTINITEIITNFLISEYIITQTPLSYKTCNKHLSLIKEFDKIN